MSKSSSTSESNLEKKFLGVTNTQDSIQSLSLWIIHHKAHSKKIVDVWMKVLKKAKIGHRLTLFYLANDVIQNSKRKGAPQLMESFQLVLPEAALLLRDEKIKGSVERVLGIWENRSIYTSELIEELKGILNNAKSQNAIVTKMVAEFKYETTIDKIREVVKLQKESALKLSALNSGKFDPADSGILQQFKDRKHGQQFTVDFEEATRCLELYIEVLEREVQERTDLIQILEQTDIYYDTQRGEARIVSNAYKNFGGRVMAQKKRLAELMERLPSPFPSPCPDAPSPSNSEEGPDFESVKKIPVLVSSPVTSIPSPEGTPEDLRLSPDQGIAASFMSQAGGLMPSWMGSFQSGSPVSSEGRKAQRSGSTSSLDNRLMNLMNKMPQTFIENKSGDETPVKDESSGQGTPVQDEEKVKGAPESPKEKEEHINHGFNDKQDSGSSGGWKCESPKKIENLVEPLQPPPKPNFGNFGELLLESFNNNIIVIKPKQDPRLSKSRSELPIPGEDDTELMDMEIEEEEEENNIRPRELKQLTPTHPQTDMKALDEELVGESNEQRSIPVISDTGNFSFLPEEEPEELRPFPEFKRGRVRPPYGGSRGAAGPPRHKVFEQPEVHWNSNRGFPPRGRARGAAPPPAYRPDFERPFHQDHEFTEERDFVDFPAMGEFERGHVDFDREYEAFNNGGPFEMNYPEFRAPPFRPHPKRFMTRKPFNRGRFSQPF